MKSILFSLIVCAAGFYLVNQSQWAQSAFFKWSPGQTIEKNSAELLTKIDEKIQSFVMQKHSEQQIKLEQLSQHVEHLSVQLKALQAAKTDITTSMAVEQVSQINTDTTNNIILSSKASAPAADTPVDSALIQRQKQAQLQDIAARMEHVSLQIASAY